MMLCRIILVMRGVPPIEFVGCEELHNLKSANVLLSLEIRDEDIGKNRSEIRREGYTHMIQKSRSLVPPLTGRFVSIPNPGSIILAVAAYVIATCKRGKAPTKHEKRRSMIGSYRDSYSSCICTRSWIVTT